MIFSEDDISFSLNATPLTSEAKIHYGLWLVLVAVTDVPPHIALINEGTYYSLSTRKIDCGSPLAKFINAVERKHIPTLFVRFETKGNISLSLEKIFINLQLLGNTKTTCLFPIKQFFAEYFSPELIDTNYVFELLALTEKKELIKECVSLFCEKTNSNVVTLPKYTMAQIRNKIQAISSQINSLK